MPASTVRLVNFVFEKLALPGDEVHFATVLIDAAGPRPHWKDRQAQVSAVISLKIYMCARLPVKQAYACETEAGDVATHFRATLLSPGAVQLHKRLDGCLFQRISNLDAKTTYCLGACSRGY